MNLEELKRPILTAFRKALELKVYRYGHTSISRGLTNRIASKRLYNSLNVEVVQNVRGRTVLNLTAFGKPISMAYDGVMVDGRRKGSKPPPYSAIAAWMKEKGISFKGVPFRQAVFMVQKGISKFGIQQKPDNFITVGFDILERDPRVGEILQELTFEELLKIIEGT